MSKRGPKTKYKSDELLRLMIENQHLIRTDAQTIVAPSNAIWIKLGNMLPHDTTTRTLYQFAKNHYDDIFRETDIDSTPKPTDCVTDALIDSDGGSSGEGADSSDESKTIEFSVSLSHTKWSTIKPISIKCKRKEVHRNHEEREIQSLQPGVWTSVLAHEIFRKTKLLCNFSFKNNHVYPSSSYKYVEINARCPSCTSTLFGQIKKEPADGEPVLINFIVENYAGSLHNGKKRRLIGAEATKFFTDKRTPLSQRIEIANEEMNLNDPEPPTMPTLNAIRCGAYREKASKKLFNDPVQSIHYMKYLPEFASIRTIGLDPFYAYYWSCEQTRIFNKYSSGTTSTKICIDASGGFVRSLQRPDQSKSRPIFLYAMTIYHNQSIVPISMMLSEQHHAHAIGNWMLEWIRSGGTIPHEFVSDMSRALLAAAVNSFAKLSTIKEYCNVCFMMARSDHIIKRPECYIRVDLAHFVKAVLNWNCFRPEFPKVILWFKCCKILI